MLRLALGDYAATPNVSLFFGKSVTADKPSPHMIDLNNSRVAICEEPDCQSINITGDTKPLPVMLATLKPDLYTKIFKLCMWIYYRLSIPMIN